MGAVQRIEVFCGDTEGGGSGFGTGRKGVFKAFET